jgi:hypothetical protein
MDLEHSDRAFDPSNWIEQGKVYKDVPIYVAADVESSTNISATSRISMRLLEHMSGSMFQSATPITNPFNTRTFVHILTREFLTVLAKETRTHPQGLIVSSADESYLNP